MVSSSEVASPLLALSNTLADAVERAGRSLVAVNARQHVPSTGIHWQPGVVVTADHTIDREEGIVITFPDGRKGNATIGGRDATTDVAVLRIDAGDLPVAEFGEAGTLKVGNVVVAVGRPGDTGLGASLGVVSSLSGSWRTWSGGEIDQLIRPDLTFYPGFSGGPLVDAAGRIVGLNTSGLSRSLGLTIPVSTVNRVVEQLLSSGRVSRGYLGLGLQPVRLPDNLKSALGSSASTALIVVSADEQGPGERAGIMVGDVVVSLDGKTVQDTHDVQNVLGPGSVGKTITAQVVRGGTPKEISVTVGERPGRGV